MAHGRADQQNCGTCLLEEDGDECLSQLELELWKICMEVRQKYAADVIFTQTAPSHPTQRDGFTEFFVPRGHTQFEEIVRDLQRQLEPLRRSLEEHHASRNLQWRPREFTHIRPYSGVAGASANLWHEKAALRWKLFGPAQ